MSLYAGVGRVNRRGHIQKIQPRGRWQQMQPAQALEQLAEAHPLRLVRRVFGVKRVEPGEGSHIGPSARILRTYP
ncbi:MAG: hypothetical protein EOO63_07740 [Hymenobacter sp.]|nr:MAG: hypothetical protein EOO63_07740 [Hymenobacter sp.]